MNKTIIKLMCTFLAMTIIPSIVCAQERIGGYVVSSKGNTISDAEIKLYRRGSLISKVKSNEEGWYEVIIKGNEPVDGLTYFKDDHLMGLVSSLYHRENHLIHIVLYHEADIHKKSCIELFDDINNYEFIYLKLLNTVRPSKDELRRYGQSLSKIDLNYNSCREIGEARFSRLQKKLRELRNYYGLGLRDQ